MPKFSTYEEAHLAYLKEYTPERTCVPFEDYLPALKSLKDFSVCPSDKDCLLLDLSGEKWTAEWSDSDA